MKALKSQLAKDVLADPHAKGQLRAYLAVKSSQAAAPLRAGLAVAAAAAARSQGPVIELQAEGRTLRLRPTVVPKAA